LSVAEPRRIARIDADVAYRETSGEGRPALVCASAPIVDASVVATMSAVRIPVFLRLRVRSTVNRRVDEERRERLRCIVGTFDVVPHERESNSLVQKSLKLRKQAPNSFWILASLAAGKFV
jgi:hypothetical protein